jgi:enoyl-CoA hydratase
MSDHLRLTHQDGVAILTIERPDRRNALDGPLWTGIGAAAQKLAQNPPKALIVTGAGGHFSSGMDLKPDNPLLQRLLPAMAAQDEGVFTALITELKGAVDALTLLPCPVIAAIEGACAGGGLEVALACDLRVAGETAFFSLPEARVGMMPDVGGTVRLSRLIGRSRAAELILTNERIDARTAHHFGLINRVATPGQALAEALRLAIQTQSSAPTATKEILQLLRSPEPTFAAETAAGVRVLCSGEAVEGVSSFFEKRPPRWS